MKGFRIVAAVLLAMGLAAAAGCGAAETGGAAKQTKSWSEPPKMAIDPNKTYRADFKTSEGHFSVDLFAKDAPITVNNFVFLAKQHFYDGVVFHRVIQDFMIQTGDPLGTGLGGPGYSIPDELNGPYKYEQGIVAMANAGRNTGGSQFFVCSGSCDHLNEQPNYAIFGKLREGMDTVHKIAEVPVEIDPGSGQKSKPVKPVTITHIDITEE